MRFFTWLAELLSDPNDQQGSTHRACLLLLILVVCVGLLLVIAAASLGKKADIPTEASGLIKFLVTILVGGIAWAKGVAGAVAVKTGERQ